MLGFTCAFSPHQRLAKISEKFATSAPPEGSVPVLKISLPWRRAAPLISMLSLGLWLGLYTLVRLVL